MVTVTSSCDMATPDALARVAFEACEDALADGCVLAEFRIAPLLFEAAADHRSGEYESESDHRRNQEAVAGMLGKLNDRERQILVRRFGIGGSSSLTLEQLGKELGITKERVRQIESRAQEKLRKFAKESKIDTQAF